jgi:ammonium transporter, Amt family
MKKLFASLGLMAFLLAPGLGLAQEAVEPVIEAASEVVEAVDAMVTPEAAPVEEAAAAEPVPDKGDTTWMMVSTMHRHHDDHSRSWRCSTAAWYVPRTCCLC